MVSRKRRVPLRPARSSSIVHIGYDSDAQRLFLEYAGGRLYEYLDVPEEIYVSLLQAESMGRFVNYAIKPHYYYQEISRRPAWVKER
jgi:uncharacterized protein (DUF2164 family)